MQKHNRYDSKTDDIGLFRWTETKCKKMATRSAHIQAEEPESDEKNTVENVEDNLLVKRTSDQVLEKKSCKTCNLHQFSYNSIMCKYIGLQELYGKVINEREYFIHQKNVVSKELISCMNQYELLADKFKMLVKHVQRIEKLTIPFIKAEEESKKKIKTEHLLAAKVKIEYERDSDKDNLDKSWTHEKIEKIKENCREFMEETNWLENASITKFPIKSNT